MNNNLNHLFQTSLNNLFNNNINSIDIIEYKKSKELYTNKKKINLCEFNDIFKFNDINNKYYNFFINWYESNKSLLIKEINDIINNNIIIKDNNDKYIYKLLIFGLIFKILSLKFNINYYIENNILFIFERK